ncbi:pentapeptide repeat-containing protein [Achromobacter mucicolens]|uniref:pentapeptide repeat-containing protein n=1 Tax=Achromobacter mucicolens TaxID=1389922 RepID=UPI003AF18BF8
MPPACPPAGHSPRRPRLRKCPASLRQASLRQASLRQASLRQASLRQALLRSTPRLACRPRPPLPLPRPCRPPWARAITALVTPTLSPLPTSSP